MKIKQFLKVGQYSWRCGCRSGRNYFRVMTSTVLRALFHLCQEMCPGTFALDGFLAVFHNSPLPCLFRVSVMTPSLFVPDALTKGRFCPQLQKPGKLRFITSILSNVRKRVMMKKIYGFFMLALISLPVRTYFTYAH